MNRLRIVTVNKAQVREGCVFVTFTSLSAKYVDCRFLMPALTLVSRNSYITMIYFETLETLCFFIACLAVVTSVPLDTDRRGYRFLLDGAMEGTSDTGTRSCCVAILENDYCVELGLRLCIV